MPYITKSADLGPLFERFTADFCLQHPDEKLTVYRVGQLSREAPAINSASATFLQHVHYLSGSEIDLPVAKECSVVYVDKLPQNHEELAANVIVVDVEDSGVHSVDEYLTGGHVVVQGKPGFQTAGSRGESIKEFIGEKLNLDFDGLSKRDADENADLDFDSETAIRDEVEADFKIAESLIAAQESDAQVTALSDDSALADSVGVAKNGTASRSNLFTHYQFFTPGVWLVLIVCAFLLYVCITAVGWITSIELSYRSFDKQVEYEKKTE